MQEEQSSENAYNSQLSTDNAEFYSAEEKDIGNLNNGRKLFSQVVIGQNN